ncbi:sigma-54 dependent transcriptional regulator [Kiloniella laminariae]|uniref:Sigma-54 dependent transcriptional regulator n=1 Tax=Kiloniella laminariae TaxID=454162 RepID=A0ABT4LMF7_9PROT|nr:sigma-54 dependent transcriptional regulator [Kiloniella laminariae]MCZ4282075.1 sigma-54 dependent transcriptional regulator [Kiloniella laminariae]
MARDILIVDDEADIRMALRGILEDEGYSVREAANSQTALEAIHSRKPSLVVLDIWLNNSELDGIGILEAIKHDYRDLPVIMMSGHGTIETAVSAIKIGAYDFVEKPFKSDRLLLIINRALEISDLRRENERLKVRAAVQSSLIGTSVPVQHLQQALDKVAPTGSRVLITGPAGAGKEVVARQLHQQSKRGSGPFVALNCATMHPDRLESELFGTEIKGENGEVSIHIGTFEQAHGGTLLLDEVADMPLETQGKIVRVLQEQAFSRVGGDVLVEVDVRVIAATNKDLQAMIAAGQFREDLFYRLNVVPLNIPALKERREDIPLLVEYFMDLAAQTNGMASRPLAQDAMTSLQAYDWPGNVRQLRNVIDWLLIMAPGEGGSTISADMMPPDIGSISPSVRSGEAGQEDLMSLSLRDARELFEKRYLEAQILRFGGNISKTSSFIGMERSALHRKLRTLGISTDRG